MYSAKRRIEEQSHLDYAKALPQLRDCWPKPLSTLLNLTEKAPEEGLAGA
jgi:hypothetical protein